MAGTNDLRADERGPRVPLPRSLSLPVPAGPAMPPGIVAGDLATAQFNLAAVGRLDHLAEGIAVEDGDSPAAAVRARRVSARPHRRRVSCRPPAGSPTAPRSPRPGCPGPSEASPTR